VEDLFPDPITDDPWLLHLHAIGVTTAIWNVLEDNVSDSMMHVGGIHPKSPLVPLLDRAGNVSKADLLVRFAVQQRWEPAGIEALEHFTRGFNICRENRNIVMHSRYARDESGLLRMLKRSSKGNPLTFSSDVEVIRQVASDMADYQDYLTAVMDVSWRRSDIGQVVFKTRQKKPSPLPAWPERPPLPRKLDPLPEPEGPQGG
jgi:hypothetical protein